MICVLILLRLECVLVLSVEFYQADNFIDAPSVRFNTHWSHAHLPVCARQRLALDTFGEPHMAGDHEQHGIVL